MARQREVTIATGEAKYHHLYWWHQDVLDELVRLRQGGFLPAPLEVVVDNMRYVNRSIGCDTRRHLRELQAAGLVRITQVNEEPEQVDLVPT
jgi:hypothetical protein